MNYDKIIKDLLNQISSKSKELSGKKSFKVKPYGYSEEVAESRNFTEKEKANYIYQLSQALESLLYYEIL